MKLHRLLPLCLLLAAGYAPAQDAFPGLRRLLTDAEWQRAGLDRLTPDQIGVIDAALIRRHAASQAAPAAAAATAAPTGEPPAPSPGATPAEAAAQRSRFWERFGIGKLAEADWRRQPPMVAKVTAWQGANRFALDTGQVWEGIEHIPYEILGQEVTISARPAGNFSLQLKPDSAEVRVRRVR
jgi:hypothetical protein